MRKYPRAVATILLLGAALACQNKATIAELQKYRAQADLEERNRSLVRNFFDAVNSGSVDKALAAVDATFAPGLATHMAAGEARGIEQIRNAFAYDYRTWSDFHYSFDSLVAEGDTVVARGGFSGNQTGRIRGVAPTGKKVTYPLIYVFRVENGKIKDWWGDFDSYLSMMSQLGLELRPKQGSSN